MKFLLIVCVLGAIGIWINEYARAQYQEGFADALKSAYRTNPPSEQLELVCVGLWIGEQNRKWYEKNK